MTHELELTCPACGDGVWLVEVDAEGTPVGSPEFDCEGGAACERAYTEGRYGDALAKAWDRYCEQSFYRYSNRLDDGGGGSDLLHLQREAQRLKMTRMTESRNDAMARLELMASGDDQWDLSSRDRAAIKLALADVRRLDWLEQTRPTITTPHDTSPIRVYGDGGALNALLGEAVSYRAAIDAAIEPEARAAK